LAIDFAQVAEIEINPCRVKESGALALDARIRILDYNNHIVDARERYGGE